MNAQEVIIGFLSDLSEHNDREWFQEHKDRYLHFKEVSDAFALEFLEKMSVKDPRLVGLGLKDITYRIYRDIRFSADKSPYKTWFGAYLSPGGKKSRYAGYYIHFEPACGCYMLCSGLYCPTPATIRSVREEIMLSGDRFEEAFRRCRGFDFEWDEAYRRVPPGWSAEDRYSEYYRLRTYVVVRHCTESEFLRDGLIDMAVRKLAPTVPFNILLDRCVDYGREMGWERER